MIMSVVLVCVCVCVVLGDGGMGEEGGSGPAGKGRKRWSGKQRWGRASMGPEDRTPAEDATAMSRQVMSQ